MTNPWMVLAGIIILAVVYVLLPVAADAFRRFRGTRQVQCPEAGALAEVGVDARHAALTAIVGEPHLRAQDCSLWPARAGCEQHCLTDLETEGAAPTRATVA